MLVTGNFSAVTQLRIPVTVVCNGQGFWYTGQIPLPGGLPIIDRQFAIRLVAGWSDPDTPVYDEYTGEFDPDFSTVQGTWRKWATFDRPICDNAGTWHASRQP
jgi:hypothetical protein